MAQVLKIPGRNTAFMVEQYDLSNNFNEYKFKRDANLIDATGFGQRFSYDLAGVQKSSLEMKGFYTPGQGNVDNIVHVRFGQDADVNVCLAPNGWGYTDGIGALNPAFMLPTVVVKYDMNTKLKDAVMIDAEFATRGAVDDGYILSSPLSFITATGNNVTSLDNLVSSVSGASAQLQIPSVTGTTPSAVFKVQHSSDNSSWADLFTFTAATAATSVRKTIDPGTTINRYVRGLWTVTGTLPVFGAALTFARGVTYS